MEVRDIVWLNLESGNLQHRCDPVSGFSVSPYEGTYIHVHEAGFRWNDRGSHEPWPPEPAHYNIFVFGGSTTFGLGEADNLVIPSWLQSHLRTRLGTEDISVYNFGSPAYFSVQERLRFEDLVGRGFAPDLAIFIDGINEFVHYDGNVPDVNCDEAGQLIERWMNALYCHDDAACLPLQRLATHLSEEADVNEIILNEDAPVGNAVELPPHDDVATNISTIERWLENKLLIEATAQAEGIDLLFVMQPAPFFGYDLQYHLFADLEDSEGKWGRTRWGYPIWNDMYQDPDVNWADNVLNLTELGADNEGPIYISTIHYTFGFMDEIAAAIADNLIAREVIE
jgi:hypothetical protein